MSDGVIEPVAESLNASMAKMNTTPEICPICSSSPLEVPSGAGYPISAPYWKPMGPALNRQKPRSAAETSSSA